jgi:hypothetical protein
MKQKDEKSDRVEIQFSDISPLELWKKLRLEQSLEPIGMEDPEEFDDEESKRAYEAFRVDLNGERGGELTLISSDKGSIFIWSLLKCESMRSPLPKLSSKKFLFKDKLFERICKKIKKSYPNIEFSEKDFEDIALYLEGKKLVCTSIDGIRITKHFTDLFHNCYAAKLVF